VVIGIDSGVYGIIMMNLKKKIGFFFGEGIDKWKNASTFALAIRTWLQSSSKRNEKLKLRKCNV